MAKEKGAIVDLKRVYNHVDGGSLDYMLQRFGFGLSFNRGVNLFGFFSGLG